MPSFVFSWNRLNSISPGYSTPLDPSAGAYQSLAQGQTTTVTVNYAVTDGTVTKPASVSWRSRIRQRVRC